MANGVFEEFNASYIKIPCDYSRRMVYIFKNLPTPHQSPLWISGIILGYF